MTIEASASHRIHPMPSRKPPTCPCATPCESVAEKLGLVIAVLVPRLAMVEQVLQDAGVWTPEAAAQARQTLGAQYAVESALEPHPGARALLDQMAARLRPSPDAHDADVPGGPRAVSGVGSMSV